MKPLSKLSSVLKRNFMPLVDKDYVWNKLAKRKGECKKCGQCCRGCPFLNKETNLCKRYTQRPVGMCFKEFPLDEKDQRAWEVKDCGYSFSR